MIIYCIIVSPPNKKTRIHYDVIPMPGDGHCIGHCFSNHFKEPMDKVLDLLDKESCENLTMYGCFFRLNKGRKSSRRFPVFHGKKTH